MQSKRELLFLGPCTLFALATLACGGSAPPPSSTADNEDDEDIISDIVGEVEVDEEDLAAVEPPGEVYTGPTKVTVQLKVVNETNPKGSFTLTDTTGTKVVEDGVFGQEYEINQGLYMVAFKTPLVLGEPTFETEINVVGKQQEVKEVFPAGQLTLQTYKNQPNGPCKTVSFSVKNTSGANPVDVPGKGKTCQPVILEAGSYEFLLDISKKKVQPVSARVNAEQVATAPVKLEK